MVTRNVIESHVFVLDFCVLQLHGPVVCVCVDICVYIDRKLVLLMIIYQTFIHILFDSLYYQESVVCGSLQPTDVK